MGLFSRLGRRARTTTTTTNTANNDDDDEVNNAHPSRSFRWRPRGPNGSKLQPQPSHTERNDGSDDDDGSDEAGAADGAAAAAAAAMDMDMNENKAAAQRTGTGDENKYDGRKSNNDDDKRTPPTFSILQQNKNSRGKKSPDSNKSRKEALLVEATKKDPTFTVVADNKTHLDQHPTTTKTPLRQSNNLTMSSRPMSDEEAVAAADKEMEARANRAKELLSQRYVGLKRQQVRPTRMLLAVSHLPSWSKFSESSTQLII